MPEDLPAELLELLKPAGDEIDANPTLNKQREIKHAAKAEAAAAKASPKSITAFMIRLLQYS